MNIPDSMELYSKARKQSANIYKEEDIILNAMFDMRKSFGLHRDYSFPANKEILSQVKKRFPNDSPHTVAIRALDDLRERCESIVEKSNSSKPLEAII